MKTKRKIMAIWVILLLVAIQISIAEASQTSTENNEIISAQLTTVSSDENFATETLLLTEAELIELENAISQLMEEIQLSKGNNVEELIDNIIGGHNPVQYSIFKSLFKIKLSRSRAIVLSFGSGYRVNLFSQNEFKIKKRYALWHYSSNGLFNGRTIIVQPFALNVKLLTGDQIGFMSRFTGVYLTVNRNFPQKSYTFFMGIARHVNGIQLAPTIQT